jgi:hypothetical protein
VKKCSCAQRHHKTNTQSAGKEYIKKKQFEVEGAQKPGQTRHSNLDENKLTKDDTIPERLEYQHKDLKYMNKHRQSHDGKQMEMQFYATEDKTLQKEYNLYNTVGRKSTNPVMKYDHSSKFVYTKKHTKNHSNSNNRSKSSEDDSLYKSPNKLKAKAKNSQILSDGTSSEKALHKLKHSRIKARRRTNPEEASANKFVLTAKKQHLNGKFSPNCDTPKSINCSSKLGTNASRKENIEINDKRGKVGYNKHKLLSDYSNSKIFGNRKNSTQTSKIGHIVLSPSNRTLLKPRKNIKNISSTKIKIVGSNDKEPKKAKIRYNYTTNQA